MTKRPTIWMRLLILLAVACAFGRIVSHDFTRWDDHKTISENPDMRPPRWETVLWYWLHPHMDLYAPVTQTTWSVLARIAYHESFDSSGYLRRGLHPEVFHGASIIVHALAALALFALLRRLLRHDAGALIGALLFALHPVQVEAVAWASGMKDLLCGLFSILALYGYLRSIEPDPGTQDSDPGTRIPEPGTRDSDPGTRDPEPGTRIPFLLATTFLILALLSKPTAMVVPVMAFAIDALLVKRPLKRIAESLLPWFALSVGCALIAKMAQPAPLVSPTPLWARPFIAGDALAFYLGKLLWPAVLVPDHARRPAAVMLHLWFYFAWLIPAAIAIALWIFRRRALALACAGIIVLAGVSPVLGLVPFDFQVYSTVSDRYLYPAMIGVALAAAWLVQRFSADSGKKGTSIFLTKRWMSPLLPTLILIALGARSFIQTAAWRDDITLWRHQVATQPRSWAGWSKLGEALRFQDNANMEQALEMYARAAQIAPLYGTQNYAAALNALGRKQEAIAVLEKFLAEEQPRPESARAIVSMTKMLNDLRR